MEKKFIIIMASVILLLSITLGVLLFTGPGINLNLDGVRNISLPEMGNFFAGTEADDAPLYIVRGDGERSRIWNMLLFNSERRGTVSATVMYWAVAEIYDRTDGVINIDHFPRGSTGASNLVFEDVMLGNIEMAVGFVPISVDNRGVVIHFPHLAICYENKKTIWTYGSNTFAIMSEKAEDNSLKLLGILPGELMGIGTTSQFNPETVWDFDQPSHELLIRILPRWILETMADAMQLRTIGIEERSEIIDALRAGDIDGWLGGSPHDNHVRYSHVINYFYDFKSASFFNQIYINRDIYYSIPENYRRIIFEVMQEASIRAIESQAELSANALQNLKNLGITVFVPTDAEREQMREAMSRRHWPLFVDEFEVGQDLLDRVLEDIR